MSKRYLKSKIQFFKFFDKKGLGSLPRIGISGVFLMLFFYVAPLVVDLTNKTVLNSQQFQNNSKTVLAYALNKKK